MPNSICARVPRLPSLASDSVHPNLPGIHLEVAAQRTGANLNALLDENLRDPLSGNAVLSGVPVRLEPDNG